MLCSSTCRRCSASACFSLTAINSIVAIGTLPLITNLAIDYFDKSESVSMPMSEVVKVFILILVPTGMGLLVRASKPSFATAMDKPVRIASALIWPCW